MTVRLTPEAEQDVDEAIRWYDQKSSSLGDEFLKYVNKCIESMSDIRKCIREPIARCAAHCLDASRTRYSTKSIRMKLSCMRSITVHEIQRNGRNACGHNKPMNLTPLRPLSRPSAVPSLAKNARSAQVIGRIVRASQKDSIYGQWSQRSVGSSNWGAPRRR